MPSPPSDWSKAKIYKIINKLDDKDVYIGGTIQHYLSDRFYQHQQQAINGHVSNGYKIPFDLHMYEIGVNNFKIEWIKDVPWVRSRLELEAEEYKVIENYINKGCYKIWNIDISKEVKSEKLSKKIKEYFKNNPDAAKRLGRENFKYGSIYKEGDSWVFRWMNNGKLECKSYSENKYGKRAKEFVLAYQKKIYPALRIDDNDNPDDILDDLKYYEIKRGNIYKHTATNRWIFEWKDENEKIKTKSYSINKYGGEGAKKLAEEMQLKRIAFEFLKKFANK